jgi:hypothetical protein
MDSPNWLECPEDHDFAAVASYLGLMLEAPLVEPVVEALRSAEITLHKAKDILRASGLGLLGEDNKYVPNDVEKVKANKKLSPILLARTPRCPPPPNS